MRNRVMERHLFDTEADEEKPLCEEEEFDSELIAAPYYLEDRLHGRPVGAVCGGCKVEVVSLALRISRDLEDDGDLDEAEDYRGLADRLARETGSGPEGRG